MKTKAVRLYGKEDLRLDEFDLPEMKEDEILAHIISDSVCMSTYKAMEPRDPIISGFQTILIKIQLS